MPLPEAPTRVRRPIAAAAAGAASGALDRRIARRRASRTCRSTPEGGRSTTRRAARTRTSARRFSSTPRASSSARGSRRFVAQVKPQLVHSDGGDDDARPRGRDVQRAQGRPHHRRHRRPGRRRSTRSHCRARNAILASNPTVPLPPDIRTTRRSSPSPSSTTKTAGRAVTVPSRTQLLGLLILLAALVALALVACAARDARPLVTSTRRAGRDPRPDRHGQERARHRAWPSASAARSSAAIPPRSIAASTSAPTRCRPASSAASRITWSTSPTRLEEYSAARYAREAAAAIRDITARGRLPILVGGTGFYYRALTRGLFPGPGRDAGAAGPARGDRGAARRRAAAPLAARASIRRRPQRIQPRDLQAPRPRARGVPPDRAAADATTSPRPRRRSPEYEVSAFALAIPAGGDGRARRAARRRAVRAGLLDEIRGLLAAGVPETAHPFSGLVYRQALEHPARRARTSARRVN